MKKTTYEQLLDKVQQRSQRAPVTQAPPSTPSGSYGKDLDYYPPDAEASLKLQNDIEARVREYSKMKSLRWSLPDDWKVSPGFVAPKETVPVPMVPKIKRMTGSELKGGEVAVAIYLNDRKLALDRSVVPVSPVGHWCSANDIIEIEVQEPVFNEWGENSL